MRQLTHDYTPLTSGLATVVTYKWRQVLCGMRKGQRETTASKRNRKFLGKGRGNRDLRPKTCEV